MSAPLWIGMPSNPISVCPADDPDPPELAAAVELELDDLLEPQAASVSETTTSINTVRARTRIRRDGSGRVIPVPQLHRSQTGDYDYGRRLRAGPPTRSEPNRESS